MRNFDDACQVADEKKYQVFNLWQQGMSSSRIAEEMGISRNSVMGIIYRLRKGGVDLAIHKKTNKNYHEPKNGISEPVYDPATPETNVAQQAPTKNIPRTIGLLDLKMDSCRFIVSDDNDPVCYCGKKIMRSSYCEDHYKRCYTPSKR